MCEVFLDVEGYEDLYEISNLGNVRNKASGKLLKPLKNSNGYLYVNLWKNGIGKFKLIHRLVAQSFIPNPNNYPQVNHIDKNKTNYNVENLEYCTAQYNIDYSVSKPVAQFSLDGRLLNTYKSAHEAERQTGIDNSNICNCCLGKRYKSAGGFIWKFV